MGTASGTIGATLSLSLPQSWALPTTPEAQRTSTSIAVVRLDLVKDTTHHGTCCFCAGHGQIAPKATACELLPH